MFVRGFCVDEGAFYESSAKKEREQERHGKADHRIEGHYQNFRHGGRGRHRAEGCGPHHRGRGDLRGHRPVGRGQEHAGAVHQPAGKAHGGHGHGEREGADAAFREGASPGAPQHRHDLPGLQPAPAAERPGQRVLPAAACGRRQEGGSAEGGKAPGARGPFGEEGRLPRPALRRPVPAGGHRPGPLHGPQGAAVRRGHLTGSST